MPKLKKVKLLNKEHLRLWRSCPRKLYHRLSGLQSKSDGDAFLRFLAEEGERVGRCARRLFRSGILIDEPDPLAAAAATQQALAGHGEIILFEPCFVSRGLVVRPDILLKRQGEVWLIEAKSKSAWEPGENSELPTLVTIYNRVRGCYREIVDDLAFQSLIIAETFPDIEIRCRLILPSPQKVAETDEITFAYGWGTKAPECSTEECAQRRESSVLKFLVADPAVALVRKELRESVDAMLNAVSKGRFPEPVLRYACRNCEFRTGQPSDGFHRCWAGLATPKPHLFDLHQLYSLKKNGGLLADHRIRAGQTALSDIKQRELHGDHVERQRRQLSVLQTGESWIAPEMGEAIERLEWPLRFLDFETFFSPVPRYVGLRPFELIPTQWSCHSLTRDGLLGHDDWLASAGEPPHLAFVRSLRQKLGDAGSILIYTDYELRVLKSCRETLCRLSPEAHQEIAWLDAILAPGRWVDQHEWAYNWWFPHYAVKHGGRSSLKVSMPAAWQADSELRAEWPFNAYRNNENPYLSLPELVVDGESKTCRDGAAAMRLYSMMVDSSGDAAREQIAQSLRDYCRLDTLAQVFLLVYWARKSQIEITPFRLSERVLEP